MNAALVQDWLTANEEKANAWKQYVLTRDDTSWKIWEKAEKKTSAAYQAMYDKA